MDESPPDKIEENGEKIVNEPVSSEQSNDESKKDVKAEEKEQPKLHPHPWCGQHETEKDTISSVYNYITNDNKEKTPMCRVAEIARFNRLRHIYDLLDESGPAHKKLFTVKLILTDEEKFEGSGSSIKKAQQAAAENAIKNTKLPSPPDKSSRKKKNENHACLRILQNICRTLQYSEPIYVFVNAPPMFPILPDQAYPPPMLFPAYFANDIMPIPNNIHPMALQKLQACVLNINGKSISTGFGDSATSAKIDAATKALLILSPQISGQQKDGVELVDDEEDVETETPKYKQKSVISKVHEKAHQMKLNVIFEVVKEEGPPHNRQYAVRCALVDSNNAVSTEATGKGCKKKEAQQEACIQVLETLSTKNDNSPYLMASALCKTQKKLAAANREPKRKTIVKDKKMDPEYGHQINPVSRLIQVVQTKKEDHPTFEFVGEHGQCRYKEFVIRVTCGSESCEGRGPNKRLAKRAAAEAMLALIGYVKPLPPPGKSLLKSKVNDQEINEPDNMIIVPDPIDIKLKEESLESPEKERKEENGEAKRKVTFNHEVQACPPPNDINYPTPIVGLLKMDSVVEGKVRRMKRSKEKRTSLTREQKMELAEDATAMLKKLRDNADNGIEDETSNAHAQLDILSTKYKFGAQFTSFPKHGNNHYFALVSLGLEHPFVCHGGGGTPREADESAAFSALEKLQYLPMETATKE